eukprot:3093533-Rhodomonas_salina.1
MGWWTTGHINATAGGMNVTSQAETLASFVTSRSTPGSSSASPLPEEDLGVAEHSSGVSSTGESRADPSKEPS